MRTLWMLLTMIIVFGDLEAQFSKIDSNLLIQFSKEGIPTPQLNRSPALEAQDGFYLVRFNHPTVSFTTQKPEIIRRLSPDHAIILVRHSRELNTFGKSLAYAFLANDLWKLPPGTSIDMLAKSGSRWMVKPIDVENFRKVLKQTKARIIEQHPASNSFVLQSYTDSDILTLFHSKEILFLQPLTTLPKEELLVEGFDLGTNRINLAHEKYPAVNGAGLVASIKENKFDTTDIDFKGRYISTGLSSPVVTGHASIMATMVGGGGNSYHLGKGVAWNSQLSSANFAQLLPAPNSVYTQFHISVENHSYGTAIENYYGADAAAYDASVTSNPSLVHVFSSGNSGSSSSTTGNYTGVPNFANLTGSFKMAKNIITVGATDSFANVEVLSSRGPAFDGRVKPDLVAFGQDGSSGAAALVSGTALLVQQAYQIQHYDSLPPASLVRATLINSADEVGAIGPDYISGFGSLNAEKAVRSIAQKRYFLGDISNKDTNVVSLIIPPGTKQFKITMAYSDLPAQPNAFQALVNDLDMDLMEVSTGFILKPWVLNISAHRDSLLLPATKNRDSLNNVEQISWDNPSPGIYQWRLYGRVVTNAAQTYAVVYQINAMDSFEWNFPTPHDHVFAGSLQVARWSETFDLNGRMEFSGNNGSSWELISPGVDLEKKYVRWQVPDSISTGMLRMIINGRSFTSDTFMISKNLQVQVGFNCEDSVLLSWNPVENADRYQVYALQSKFLEPVNLRTDTFFVFSKFSINSKHFTVSPKLAGFEGVKAFTINYETQGVGCYIKQFLVQLNNASANILLELGSLYKLKEIEIQKDSGNNFTRIQTFIDPSQLIFQIENNQLHPGINRFRTKLTLADGTIIYSQEEIIYFLANNEFIVYPNPAKVTSGFNVLRKDLDDATLLLYDLYGRRIMEVAIKDLVNAIPTSTLQRGVYFMAIYDVNGNRKYTGKIVLQ